MCNCQMTKISIATYLHMTRARGASTVRMQSHIPVVVVQLNKDCAI